MPIIRIKRVHSVEFNSLIDHIPNDFLQENLSDVLVKGESDEQLNTTFSGNV